MDYKMFVGARLKECRVLAGKKQREVADKLGMVVQQYQKFESGKFELNYERLVAVCKFLDVSADYLLGIEEPQGIIKSIIKENDTDKL